MVYQSDHSDHFLYLHINLKSRHFFGAVWTYINPSKGRALWLPHSGQVLLPIKCNEP